MLAWCNEPFFSLHLDSKWPELINREEPVVPAQ